MLTNEFERQVMKVFRGEEPDFIPWQPRLEMWYNYNKERYGISKDIVEFYKELDAYMRLYVLTGRIYGLLPPPFGEYNLPIPIEPVSGESFLGTVGSDEEVRISRKRVGNDIITIYETPLGSLRSVDRFSPSGQSWYRVEYPIKELERDVKIMCFILERTDYKFDRRSYELLREWLRGQGMIWACIPRTPLPRLIIEYMGARNTYLGFLKNKLLVEELMEAIKLTIEKWIDKVLDFPIEVITIPDNIDVRLISPNYYSKYCLEYYQEISDKLHSKKKVVLLHCDGYIKPLLNLISESGIDGIEAVTFKPGGDVEIDEVKKVIKDKLTIVDGIPYLCFMPETDVLMLRKIIDELLKNFYPRIILGISDELPPMGDIQKVRQVSMILKNRK